MSLPMNEDTSGNQKNYIWETVQVDHIEHTAPGTELQGDMIIDGPWCGIADHGLAQGEVGTINVAEGLCIQTKRIGAGAIFATRGGDVWFDPDDENYYDTEAAGRYHVGYVRIVLNANGVIYFEKTRYAIESELT